MNKLNGILGILSILLVAVVVIEVGVFFKPNLSQFFSPSDSTKTTSIPELSERMLKYAEDVGESVSFLFQEGKKGKLSNLNLSYTYTGVLESIDIKEKKTVTTRSKIPFTQGLALTFKTTEGNSRTHRFTKEEFARIKFVQRIKDQEVPIAIEQFKPGDKIEFTNTINLLKNPQNNLVEAKLVKSL